MPLVNYNTVWKPPAPKPIATTAPAIPGAAPVAPVTKPAPYPTTRSGFDYRNPYKTGPGLTSGLTNFNSQWDAFKANQAPAVNPYSGLPIQPAGTQPTTIPYNPTIPTGTETYTPASTGLTAEQQQQIAASMANASNIGSAAATRVGDQQQQAQAAAMGAASDIASAPAGISNSPSLPMPGYVDPVSGGDFNTQYATPENVSKYSNPFLDSIMKRGQNALDTYNPGVRPERQQATTESLDLYNDPGYQFRLQQGVAGLDASAASRGGLLSSGHMKDIEDYSQGLASQEFQNVYNRFTTGQNNIQNDFIGDRDFGYNSFLDAVGNGVGADATIKNAFLGDRNYMTDNYWKNRTANTNDINTANNFNWDLYKYGNADYQGRLGDYYAGNNGLVNTGINASNNAGTIYSNYGNALAELFGQGGNVGAASAVNSGNINSDALQGLLGALLSYGGG